MFPLKTERLCIRPVKAKDLDAIWVAAHVPGLTEGMKWEAPQSKEALAMSISQEQISGVWYPLVIADRNDELLGRFFLNGSTGSWEIGYWLLPEHQGKGYALEAAQAMIDYAFHELKADKVIASSCTWNKKSSALLAKLGMKSMGIKPAAFQKGESVYDLEEFSLAKKSFSRLM